MFNLDENSKFNRQYKILNLEVPELNWNPYVIINGNKKYYQREFVWTLKQKQSLIESMYMKHNIGQIIFKKYEYNYIEEQIKNGNYEVAFNDIVDGKQRLGAIVEFINNKIPDFDGNYYGYLSGKAQGDFLNSMNVSFTYILSDDPKDILAQFLKVNIEGVPQSPEHIDYVKSLFHNIM